MRTLRDAAALLAAADSADALAPLVTALGFDQRPLPVDEETREAIGIPPDAVHARVARGAGSLRALVVALPRDDGPIRAQLARLAARLAARSPFLHWIVAAVEQDGPHVALAAWSAHRTPPRVAALVVDRRRVVDSDAETVRTLVATAGAFDVLTHQRWLDVLGREGVTRRFFAALERLVGELADAATGDRTPSVERRALALLHVSRLLFLSFLEAKGWLDADADFLSRGFAECMATGGGYHRRVLLPLIFGTLNTPPRRRAPAARAFGRVPFLNGGLFARTALERRHRDLLFPDETLGRVFGDLLSRYRFTAREDSTAWSEAAVDPEMLGRAFEALMASDSRRATGAFYTPQAVVEQVTTAALRHALADAAGAAEVEAALRGEPVLPRARAALRARATELRVLDPACGSGAFLVHALERLAALLGSLGDARPVSAVRRELVTASLFGVDVSPTAVWLCELRLWLSVLIEGDETDPMRVPPLPNLDRNVRIGDTLSGAAFEGGGDVPAGRVVARLRHCYTRAAGPRKRGLARALDRAERAHALRGLDARLTAMERERRELLSVGRGRDLFGGRAGTPAVQRARLVELRADVRQLRARRRALIDGGAIPFSFAAHFADVAARDGFDLALGNPPWVRLRYIPRAARAALRRAYASYRLAAWERGAGGAHAGRGFASQVDLAALFAERSLTLLRPGGVLALLLPAKLWRSLAGGGVRRVMADDAELLELEDWSESRHAFDAAVYPSLLVARRRPRARRGGARVDAGAPGQLPLAAAVRRRESIVRWSLAPDALPLDETPGSPWLLIPRDVRASFDAVAAAAAPLGASEVLGRPQLGVKCGRNEAFLVSLVAIDGEMAVVRAGERQGRVEPGLLRPVLRGEGLSRWRVEVDAARAEEYILWTHDARGAPLDRLPPHAARWLAPWRRTLAARADARERDRWWALFRTSAADDAAPRVVWSDLGRVPRAAILPAGDRTVPLNSCYAVRCRDVTDARALAALLNGPLAACWLNVLAEPARGGYRRYLAWTLALLPIPSQWDDARQALSPLGERGFASGRVDERELLDATLRAYALAERDVHPLLAWRG